MGGSLQDQLLKAGAVSKQKAQNANSKLRKKHKQQNKGQAGDQAKILAEKAQAEKRARDQKLNQQRQQQAAQQAISAQIKQIIEQNRLSREECDIAYNFLDGTKVRKLHVDEKMQRALSSGRLGIVRSGAGYELIPEGAAAKIRERDESLLIPITTSAEQIDNSDEDDPYADYQIPDDLMW